MEFRFLGPPTLVHNGNPVSLPTKKAMAILAYLITSAKPVSREALATMFWPELDQQSSLNNLRQSLFNIKRTLGDVLHTSTLQEVSVLLPKKSRVDTNELIDHNALGMASIFENQLNAASLRHLHAAISLYKGEFLEGLLLPECSEYDLWAHIERDKYHRIITNSYELLVYHYLISNNYNTGIHLALDWLRLDNCNEAAHRSLMILYARTGMRKQAVAQYQYCINTLRDELGVTPDHHTKEVAEAIRTAEYTDLLVSVPPVIQRKTANRLRNRSGRPSLLNVLPGLPNIFVQRPRLIAKLNEGLQVPLTVLSAPAGYGKTVLLTGWLSPLVNATEVKHIWYPLSPSEDLDRFLATFRRHAAQACFNTAEPHGIDYDFIQCSNPEVLKRAIMDTLAHQSTHPVVIVLEDFHNLHQRQDVIDAIEEIITHSPENVHYYITTRGEQRLSFAKRAAARGIVTIDRQDLEFTIPEIKSIHGSPAKSLQLTKDEITRLHQRTEGWAAGIFLTLGILDDVHGSARIFNTVAGGQEQIIQYLIEEVFQHLSEDEQTFLLTTSILTQLNDSLCAAVSNLEYRDNYLEALYQKNMFLKHIDSEKTWYRHHYLFQEALSRKLASTFSPIEITALHRRAAAWYFAHQFAEEAIEHGLLAQDYSMVTMAITTSFSEKIANGDLPTLHTWLHALPAHILEAHAFLQIVLAWTLVLGGSVDAGEQIIADCRWETSNHWDEGEKILAHLLALKAYVAETHGDYQQSIVFALEARNLYSPQDYIFNGVLDFILGRSYRILGKLEQAETTFERIRSIGCAIASPLMESYGTCDIATILQIRGRLNEAAAVCQHYLQHAIGKSRPFKEAGTRVLFRFADILYEKNNLKRSATYVSKGFELLQQRSNPNDTVFGHIVKFQLLMAHQELLEASSVLANAAILKGECNLHSHLTLWLDVCTIRMHIARSQWSQARQLSAHISQYNRAATLEHEFATIEHLRTQALYHSSLSDDERANEGCCEEMGQVKEAVAEMLAVSLAAGREHRYLQLLCIDALCSKHLGSTAAALEALETALVFAAEHGHVRTIVDMGEPIMDLLEQRSGDTHGHDTLSARLRGAGSEEE